MQYGKSELIRRLSDIARKGWSNNSVRDLIDSLWRDTFSTRTGGFNLPGGTDAEMGVEYYDYPDSGSGSGSDEWPGEPDEIQTPWFYIQPVSTKFSFYQFITQLSFHKKTATDWCKLPDEEGLYMIYYEADETSGDQILKYIKNPTREEDETAYTEQCIVAYVYWNATDKVCEYLGDERHGSEWNPQINWWAGRAFGGLKESGLELTNLPEDEDEYTGADTSDSQVGITAGIWLHEDIKTDQPAIDYTTGLPVMYFSTSNHLPRVVGTPPWPVYLDGGEVQINEDGEVLTPVTENYLFWMHLFATNCLDYPVIAIMGQSQFVMPVDCYNNLGQELEDIKGMMPQKSWALLGSVIFRQGSTNGADCRIYGQFDLEKQIELIAEEKMPFRKTGWMPAVWELVAWSWDDVYRYLLITTQNICHYFLDGKRTMAEGPYYIEIEDMYGMHYIYIDDNGITVTQTPWLNSDNDKVMVAAVFWNPALQRALYVGFEMHSYEVEPRTRNTMHETEFCRWVSGLEVTLNMDNTIAVAGGEIHDEDIVALIGTGFWGKQAIAPLEASKYYLMSYDDGGNGSGSGSGEGEGSGSGSGEGIISDEWENDISNLTIPVIIRNNHVCINEQVDGAWQLTEVEDGTYIVMWLIATMDYREPLKWIVGSGSGDTKEEADANNPASSLYEKYDATGFFAEEWTRKSPIAKVIIKAVGTEPYFELTEVEDTRDEALEDEAGDIYVDSLEFDEFTRELTATRTGGKEPLVVEIPGVEEAPVDGKKYARCDGEWVEDTDEGSGSGEDDDEYRIEDIAVDYIDIEAGTIQTKILDIKASFAYIILSVVLQSDDTMDDIAIQINGTPVTGLDAIDVTTAISDTEATADNIVTAGDQVTLVTSGTDGDPTLLRVKLRILRVVNPVEDIPFDYNDVEPGTVQTYILDMKASFAYIILSAVLQSDDTMDGVAIKIGSTAVAGLDAIDVTTAIGDTAATADRSVAIGDQVALITSGTDGDPTLIRGKLRIQRI